MPNNTKPEWGLTPTDPYRFAVCGRAIHHSRDRRLEFLGDRLSHLGDPEGKRVALACFGRFVYPTLKSDLFMGELWLDPTESELITRDYGCFGKMIMDTRASYGYLYFAYWLPAFPDDMKICYPELMGDLQVGETVSILLPGRHPTEPFDCTYEGTMVDHGYQMYCFTYVDHDGVERVTCLSALEYSRLKR